MSKGKILFKLSGSIACYKSCSALSRLSQSGYEVEVVATQGALQFVGESTLEGLTGRPVHTDTFARGHAMSHINLAKWADLVVVCPATANTINKLAAGVGDDLLTTLFLAHDFSKPYLIAPAMNTRMYRHPATQASMRRLREWGVEVLETGSGNLACGDVGEGRLLEPDQLIAEIEKRFAAIRSSSKATAATGVGTSPVDDVNSATRSAANESALSAGASLSGSRSATPVSQATHVLDILITSGGTREPLDGVRSITNFSTGRTGAVLAEHLRSKGHHVTYLHAQGAVTPKGLGKDIKDLGFVTFSDLEHSLRQELSSQKYDAVIHMAAVSDYSIASLESEGRALKTGAEGKIDSDGDLTLRLKRNPKIVDHLRGMSRNPEIKVVAFKLTNSRSADERKRAVEKLAGHAKPDLIVHNDLHEIDAKGDLHLSTIYSARGGQTLTAVAEAETKGALALELERLLKGTHV